VLKPTINLTKDSSKSNPKSDSKERSTYRNKKKQMKN